MLSIDMIGYNTMSDMYLNIAADARSQWLGDHITAMNDSFSVGFTLNAAPYYYGTWSDHSPFWTRGFPAVCLIENAPPWLSNMNYSANPYYHKTDDTLETLNMDLVERSTKLALVSAATLGNAALTPVPRDDVRPGTFALHQNYPNPFNATTVISYQLSAFGQTSLVVYDAIGRVAAVLVNEEKEAGLHSVQFDGVHLASGIYWARLTSNGTTQVRQLVLLK
jgi:hypothetical protein